MQSPITYALIGITCLVSWLAFNNRKLADRLILWPPAIDKHRQYDRLVTYGFIHADFMHLLFNMMTLYFFGPIVLQAFGEVGFLVVYFGSILLGNLFSLYLYQNQSWYSAIGASGGVSGILFASIAMIPDLGIYFFFIPIPIPGYIFGLLYFGYSVYSMLNPRQHDNIGHAAHMGGAFFGLVYAVALQPERAIENSLFLGIMALPLIYMAYMVFVKKKIG